MFQTLRRRTVALCLLSATGGCDWLSRQLDLDDATMGDGETTGPGTGTITRDAPVAVVDQVVEPSGGTITVTAPGAALDGMTIDVQAGSYAEPRTFSIRTEAIQAHTFGPDFNPISPLVTIRNGGGYAERPMVLRVPVRVPEGHFAMGFLFDEATGTLEGLPILESEPDHVTVFTMNFEHNRRDADVTLGALSWGSASGALEDAGAESKIVMSSVPSSRLLGEGNTGFTPGVDDMPFINRGSHAEPGGFCAGSSIGAMWYYTNKKQAGAEPIWTRLEGDGRRGIQTLEYDDVAGIKFASMIQTGYGGPSFIDLVQMLGQALAKDDVTMAAFRYAIKLTGAPQFAAIFPGLGGGGHAVTVYKVRDIFLHVADPNYPGNKERVIVYDDATSSFMPFSASTKLGAQDTLYTSSFYTGRTSLVNWHRPAKHWAEVEAGTIGADSFPKYTLRALDENVEGAPLVDGFRVRDGRLSVIVAAQGFDPRWEAYDESGTLLQKEPELTAVVLPKAGKQWVGIAVFDDNGDWVGFDWLEVEAVGSTPSTAVCPENLEACHTLVGRATTCGTPSGVVEDPCSCISCYCATALLDCFRDVCPGTSCAVFMDVACSEWFRYYQGGRTSRRSAPGSRIRRTAAAALRARSTDRSRGRRPGTACRRRGSAACTRPCTRS